MTALAITPEPSSVETLPALAEKIALARQLLEAGNAKAAFAVSDATYDQARAASSFAARMKLNDDLRAEAKAMVGLALEISTHAEIGIANEYERAKEAGVVSARGRPKKGDGDNLLKLENFGLSKERLHHIRTMREAETKEPGFIKRVIAARVADGFEPSRANLRAAVGTASASKDERGDNFYQTPRVATQSLLAFESFSETIWEPCCGHGAISAVLEENGYSVILSDLRDRGAKTADGTAQSVGDFLHSRPETAGEGPDIVSNFPYGEDLNALVAHALRVHKPRKLALLLNLNFQCGFADDDRNFVMDENPPTRVYVFKRRLPMMHREGWEGKKASSRMNTAWFIWERGEDDSYSGDGWMRTRRIDWADYGDADSLEPGEGGHSSGIVFDEFSRETPRRTLEERLDGRRDEARAWATARESFTRGELRRAIGVRDGDAEALIGEFLAAGLVQGPDEDGRYGKPRTADMEDFPTAAPESVTLPAEEDLVLSAIISSGLEANSFLLELNSGLTNNLPCALPSRLFRFPVEYIPAQRLGGSQSRLVLRHPDLRTVSDVSAYLDDVEAKAGIRVEWAAPEEIGRDVSSRWQWLHAVDLCSDKHWKGLLETRNFTEDRCIFRAVSLRLQSKELSLKNARTIMAELASEEPGGRSEAALLGKGLWPYQTDKKKYIAPNIGLDGADQAWLTIHGMEDGWLAYVGGHLSVTAEGMERRERSRVAEGQDNLPMLDGGAACAS